MAMDPPNESPQVHQTPGTPPRPPYSPVTPVMTHASLFAIPGSEGVISPLSTGQAMLLDQSTSHAFPFVPQPTENPSDESRTNMSQSSSPTLFAPEPAPVPISESDNPDAIALRSAISILQIQKQQALRDIRALDKMKQAAAENPERFVQEILKGNTTASGNQMEIAHTQLPANKNEKGRVYVDGQHQNERGTLNTGFGKIPKPQDVVRMPPINWAKYHIVGEPLDRLHEEQRRRPSPGEPRRDTPTLIQRAPEHVIAAPYRPFTDRLDSPMKTRSSNKRKNEQT